jgi:hypothetical protein
MDWMIGLLGISSTLEDVAHARLPGRWSAGHSRH